MAGLIQFNRFINVMLYGADGTFVIKTPEAGRKPEVSVHGLLMSSDYAKDFEIRVTNLYSEVDLSLFNRISVTAGYYGRTSMSLDGSISVLYTEQPGPDRVTVIKCFIGNAEQIINATCNIELPAGSTLKVILDEITNSMNRAVVPESTNAIKTIWREPQIDPALAGLVCNSKLSHNGTVKDLMPLLKQIFPGVYIVFENNQLVAYDPEIPYGSGKLVPVTNIQSPPSYTAGHVIVTAPWEPSLKPGDVMSLPASIRTMGVREASATMRAARKGLKKLWRVISVQFDFSTTGNQNKMIVTGV